MPFTVTHVLVPILLLDAVKKLRGSLSLHTIFVAGIVGALPDIDVVAELVWFATTGSLLGIHRLYTHTLVVPVILAIVGIVLVRWRPLFLAGAFAWTVHVILDLVVAGQVPLLFPFSNALIGLNLLVPPGTAQAAVYILSGLDAVIFLVWLWHEERYRKIKDFF